MRILHDKTTLMRAGDIEIPDIYFQRFRTSIERLDLVFGDGILPGSTITINANPGTGKTTLMLQLLQLLTDRKHKTAYISGEESIYMVAIAAKRLKSLDVCIANESRLSKILAMIPDNNVLVIDSFPTIVYDLPDADDFSGKKQDERKLELIIEAAQEHTTSVVFILHNTKNGNYKGGTDIQHAVDVNVRVLKDEDNPAIRIIDTYKNRAGKTGSHVFNFADTGYDFITDPVVVEDDEEDSGKKKGKGSRRESELIAIMKLEEPITIKSIMTVLGCDSQRAQYLTWLLTSEGKLRRVGRGTDKFYEKVEE